MESRQLEYFRQVVEHGSFTAAANALHMTQPSLSLVVQRLEKELGMSLLIRSRQGVQLTEAGAHLYAVAVKVLEQMDSVALHIQSLASGTAGRVTLSSTPIFNWGHLATILRELGRLAPDVEIVLNDPPPDQTVRDVLEGSADIGIVTAWDMTQLQALYGDRLKIAEATELPLVAVLPPGWPDIGTTISLAQLRDEKWIMPSTSAIFPGLPELLEHLWNIQPNLRPTSIQKTSGVQTALPLVAAGLGVTVVPETVRRLADASVSIRAIEDSIPLLHAMVIWRRDTDLSPAVKRIIRLILGRSKE